MTVCTACIGEEPAKGPSKGGPAPQPLPYEVSVTSASTGLRSALQAGEFEFVLDAGRALGGEQSAASPVQAFIGSIVACTQVWLSLCLRFPECDMICASLWVSVSSNSHHELSSAGLVHSVLSCQS